METKTEKITSVQENQRQYSGKSPMFIHLIKFENDKENRAWEYHSTSEVCDKFKVGETTTFTIDIAVNGNFTNYKISPPKASNGFSGGNGMSKAPNKDSGIITYLSCFSSACNFYATKLQNTENDVLELAEKAFKKAMEKKQS